ncbi:hypothetical protein [Streptomyces sp. NPDC002540]
MEQKPARRFDPPPGRIAHVGGIESLVLDGHHHCFGFECGSDTVLSPLVDGPQAMAAFASEHMRQTAAPRPAARTGAGRLRSSCSAEPRSVMMKRHQPARSPFLRAVP